jgi:hypothetical protein
VINGVDVSLVGTWSSEDSDSDLLRIIFFEDGTYLHAEVKLGGVENENGMEWGTFSRDATDGMVTSTQIFDSNGGIGLTDFVGADAPFLFTTVSADELTATIDEDGDGTIDDTELFQREPSAGILGSWIYTDADNPNDLLVLVFSDDDTYVHAEVNNLYDMDEVSGMEYGLYEWDEDSGLMTVFQQTFDENGESGLTEFVGLGPPYLYINIDGDVLTAVVVEDDNGTIVETLSFARLP